MREIVRRTIGAALVAAALGSGACGGARAPSKSDPEVENARKVRLAESYVQAGRLTEGLRILEEAATADPENPGIQNYLGQVALLAGRFPLSERSFRRALEIDPLLTDAYNGLGAVLDRVGRKDEAEASFKKALDDPAYRTPEKIWLNLGILYASQGRDDEAIRALRQAVEIDPKFFRAHYELASVLDRTGKVEEAARLYEVAAPEYRGDATYHYRLGLVYMKLRDRDKARIHLNRVLELSPGSENAVKASDLLKVLG